MAVAYGLLVETSGKAKAGGARVRPAVRATVSMRRGRR
jgi:hypothetical protein